MINNSNFYCSVFRDLGRHCSYIPSISTPDPIQSCMSWSVKSFSSSPPLILHYPILLNLYTVQIFSQGTFLPTIASENLSFLCPYFSNLHVIFGFINVKYIWIIPEIILYHSIFFGPKLYLLLEQYFILLC